MEYKLFDMLSTLSIIRKINNNNYNGYEKKSTQRIE